GVATEHAIIPAELVAVVARFTGRQSCAQIAASVEGELGEPIEVELVVSLAAELERGLFLDGERFRAARAKVESEFSQAALRPASHAGGAYVEDPRELARFLDEKCLGAHDAKAPPPPKNGKRLVGLIAPHIDPWRGRVGYGHAY